MIGEKSAIKKYLKSLPEELSKRYGGKGPYTEGQVRTTVYDLSLSKKYIHYAYLIFCEQGTLDNLDINQELMVSTIQKVAGVASGPDGATTPSGSIFGFDGGGFGDGGFGGDGGCGGDGGGC